MTARSFGRHAICFVVATVIGLVATVANATDQFAGLETVVAPASQSVVEVRVDDRTVCLGTVVARGLVIAKYSEVTGPVTCRNRTGQQRMGRVIASDPMYDLGLIELEDLGDQPQQFARSITFIVGSETEVGDLLVSVGLDSKTLAIGLVTTRPQIMSIAQPVCRDCIDLGATVAKELSVRQLRSTMPNAEGAPVENVAGVDVQRVYPRTVAEKVGLLQDDLLVSVNDRTVYDRRTLMDVASTLRVGQSLSLVVVRNGQRETLAMTIESFLSRVYHDRWGGGPFSQRRFGFGKVIVHDTLLSPKQCGGPLVDLDGKLSGLNIARSLRVATLAVPADRVREFVRLIRPDAILEVQDELE